MDSKHDKGAPLRGRATAAEPEVSALRDGVPSAMTHEDALDAIVGCAATVTLLSYQEAIEGYLQLRGWSHD